MSAQANLSGYKSQEKTKMSKIELLNNLKGSKTKEIALEQMKLLATMSSEFWKKNADIRKNFMNIIDL